MLSRVEFERACKLFLEKHTHSDDQVFGRWEWSERPGCGLHTSSTISVPEKQALGYASYGFLMRKIRAAPTSRVLLEESSEDCCVCEEEDPAIAVKSELVHPVLDVWQYIVYSASFQVPAFYFSVHTPSGSALSLDELLASPLFHHNKFPGTIRTCFALHDREQPFPFLSQGEHPVLGTACWFFHPCETAKALGELVQAEPSTDIRPERILELWLLLVGNVLNLRD